MGMMAGAIGAAILAAPFTGGLSLAALAAAGAGAGGLYAYSGKKSPDTANDFVYPSGYGDSQLVTPSGTVGFNNNDIVMAGTKLPAGTLQGGSDEALVASIRELVTMLKSANTNIEINGQSQKVNRMQLVGVYSRNEVT